MSTDLPPASISGQHGWEWNQLRSQQEPDESPATSRDQSAEYSSSERRCRPRPATDSRRQSSGVSGPGTDTCQGPTDVSRGELAAALERKERRLQRVIDHYELLLERKNRQLTKQREPTSSDRLGRFFSSLFEYLRPLR